jgi:Cof subfamily protein (haloacid dehalogenase superfamily)
MLGTVRLVACDLDGTLLDHDGNVPAATADAVLGLHEHGIEFLPVTARMPRAVGQIAEALPSVSTFVCANGAIVYDPVRRRERTRLDLSRSETVSLVRLARRFAPGVRVALETRRGYVREHDFARRERVRGEAVVDDVLASGFLASSVKVSVQTSEADLDAFSNSVVERLAGRYAVTVSGGFWVDLSHRLASKVNAVARWAKAQGITREEVLAVGGAPNDLALLLWAGVGAAMETGHPTVRAAADMTVAGADDGVTELLHRVLGHGKLQKPLS